MALPRYSFLRNPSRTLTERERGSENRQIQKLCRESPVQPKPDSGTDTVRADTLVSISEYKARKRKKQPNICLIALHESLPKHRLHRAIDGTRTRDFHLGKVALYQLSHYRICLSKTSNTILYRKQNVNPQFYFFKATCNGSVSCLSQQFSAQPSAQLLFHQKPGQGGGQDAYPKAHGDAQKGQGSAFREVKYRPVEEHDRVIVD